MAGCVARQDTIEPVGEQEEQVAVVKTRQGKFVIEFHPNSAPVAVENFKNLVRKRFYDGLTFHRRENTEIMNIIQGGDPNGDGTGGPGYTISDEYANPNQRPHLRGTVAMARTRAPNSAGSQFYICLNPQPLLDGSYTTFGQVIKGMNVVDKLRVGDVMKTVKLEARSEHVKSE
jgi:peptidyl-prolyl cis-trans isomerase B (cyclophilin B)